jgi:hypothetical protein
MVSEWAQAALPLPRLCRTGSHDRHDFDPRLHKVFHRRCRREPSVHRNDGATKHCHILMSMFCAGASEPATAELI